MSDAEKAYQAAEAQIEKARQNGDSNLYLAGDDFAHLARIPPAIADLTETRELYLFGTKVSDLSPLAGLTALQTLNLSHCQVADIAPLAGLTALEELSLSNCQVADIAPLKALSALRSLWLESTVIEDVRPLSGHENLYRLRLDHSAVTDLRPLADLTELIEGKRIYRKTGLSFSDTPATALDPEGLGRLAKIEDDEERTRETLAYLKTLEHWPPSEPEPLEQEAALRVVVTDQGAEVEPALPDVKELRDAVKRDCHEELSEAATIFNQAASNLGGRIATRARRLTELLAQDFEDLNFLRIHMQIESLRRIHERRGERRDGDALSDDAVDALEDVINIGPGLVLDNEQVEAYEARARRMREAPSSEAVIAAEDRIMIAIRDEHELMGEEIRGLAAQFENAEDETDIVARATLAKNTPIGLGQYLLPQIAGGAIGAATGAVLTGAGQASAVWLIANYDQLHVIAGAYGPAFEHWLAYLNARIRQWMRGRMMRTVRFDTAKRDCWGMRAAFGAGWAWRRTRPV